MSVRVDPFLLGEYYLFGLANFTPVQRDGIYIVSATSWGSLTTHFQVWLLSLFWLHSGSHLIVHIDPASFSSHFLIWSLLQQQNLKKMEDTMRSTRLRIRMQVEQAMNEVIEFFSSILIFLSLLKTAPVAFGRVSYTTHVTCSAHLWIQQNLDQISIND